MTWIHYAWLAIAALFYLGALWGFLERKSGSGRKHDPKLILRQGHFVLVCSIVCILIDLLLLPAIYNNFVPSFLPLGMLQFALLPAVLFLGALLIGGTEAPSLKRPKGPRR